MKLPPNDEHWRYQFPCNLSYALTIHKSQGQTYDKVRVGLGYSKNIHGLNLVALSRTRCMNDMLLDKFDIKKVFKITAGDR